MSYLLAALLTSLSFAILNNLNGIISRKTSALAFSLWANIFGVILFLPLVLLVSDFDISDNLGYIGLSALLAVCVNLGFLAFITAMRKGSITVTGVIGGSYPAVATLIGLFAFSNDVDMPELLAIILILAATTLSVLNTKPRLFIRNLGTSGAIYAFAALLLWGVFYGFIETVVEPLGWFFPVYLAYVVGLVLFSVIAIARGETKIFKPPTNKWLILIAAVLSVTGSSMYTLAVTSGPTAVVAPIAGSSPALFVVIAYFLFKEKLLKIQWFGIIFTVFGIICLAIVRS